MCAYKNCVVFSNMPPQFLDLRVLISVLFEYLDWLEILILEAAFSDNDDMVFLRVLNLFGLSLKPFSAVA